MERRREERRIRKKVERLWRGKESRTKLDEVEERKGRVCRGKSFN